MLYGRNQLNKAGDALIGDDPFKRGEALETVQAWRETHLPVLQELNRQAVEYLRKGGVEISIPPSMRVKRLSSIEAKLRNNIEGGMKLGGMQDIGGARYVFAGIEILDKAELLFDCFEPEGFEFKRKLDYVANPKESGYRSVHYVYQYKSDDEKYDGVKIEIQLRTRLQHAWAMAVETASLISNATLKADLDNAVEWRGFFKLVSALFARKEFKPVGRKYSGYTDEDFCSEYFKYDESKLVDKLRALRITVNFDFEKDYTKGYCVLVIDFTKRRVSARAFSMGEAEAAYKAFSQIETDALNRSDTATLMVAIEKIQEIREAYPSYFLDTGAFLKYLEAFEQRCRIYRAGGAE